MINVGKITVIFSKRNFFLRSTFFYTYHFIIALLRLAGDISRNQRVIFHVKMEMCFLEQINHKKELLYKAGVPHRARANATLCK